MVFYYAVASGKERRIVNTWDECKALTDGFKGAVYKKFTKLSDAEAFMSENAPVKRKSAV